MPRGQPFTAMCLALARPIHAGRADLHTHTTASDGEYIPSQLLDVARKAGLALLAVTDHDTLAGAEEAQELARAHADGPRVLVGVEITARHLDRDTHILAYGFNTHDTPLLSLLQEMRERRVLRHRARLDALSKRGISLPDLPIPAVPGRRHLAKALSDAGLANSLQDAFRRFRPELNAHHADTGGIEMARVLSTVNNAGGYAVLAHPPQGTTLAGLKILHGLGLTGIEAEYPDFSRSWTSTLRAWSRAVGLHLTGGSDCHGPGPRSPGCRNIDPSHAGWIDTPSAPFSSLGGSPCSARSGAN